MASSLSNYFARDWYQGPLISALLAGYYVLRSRNILFTKTHIIIITILVFYFSTTFVLFQKININYALGIILRITAIFWALRILQFNFFIAFEKIVSFLALVSIILYPFQFYIFDPLFNSIKSINDLFPFFFYEADNMASIIIFNLKSEAIFRNSGFMWEPGAFAALLLISMMLNMIFNKFQINKGLIIQFIALLTTLSTMGYLGLTIILLFYYLNNPGKIKLLITIFILPTVIFMLFNFSFVMDEVFKEYNNVGNVIDYAYTATNYKYTSLGRMGSFVMDVRDLKKSPVLGIAGNVSLMTQPYSETMVINRTCGLSNYLLTFGLLGFYLLIYNLYNTSQKLKAYFNFKAGYLFVVVILFLSFSNTILETFIFLGFQIFYLTLNLKYINIQDEYTRNANRPISS